MLFLLLLCALGAGAARGAGIEMRADPDRLPADGTSQAVIIAEVTDANGAPVPDGTTVRFLTTAGRIVSPVQTMGGLAQTALTSSRAAAVAVVSVLAGGTRGVINVEFTALPGSRAPGARSIEVTADDLAYGGDLCLFVATDHAQLQMGTISVRADGFQYEVASDVVRAQGRVVLQSGDREIHADALRYDLLALRGRLIRLTGDGRGERMIVEGERLEERPDDSKDEALWEPLKTGETRAWVRVTRALVDPGNRIVLDHAAFYVDNVKVLSLRRHVVPTRPTSALLGQVLGFSSSGGVSVDYPYYFAAGAHSIGALHFRRNAATGGQYSPGWTLGMSEEYTREGQMEGEFSLDDLRNPAQGLHWQHQQFFPGGLSADADFDSVSFDGSKTSYRTSGLNVTRPLGGGGVTLSLGKSSYGGSTEQSASLGYRFSSFNLGSGLLATPSFGLRQSARDTVTQEMVIDPVTGEPLTFNSSARSASAGLDLGISLRERNIGAMKLTGSVSTGYSWLLSSGTAATQFSTRWTLDRKFGRSGYAGLTFHYSITPPGLQTGLLSTNTQQALSLTARSKVKEGFVGLRLTQSLDGARRYGSLNFTYPLPLGKDSLGQPVWTLDGFHMFSQLELYQAQHTVLSLNRTVGKYQASLKYSPEGGGSYGANRPWISPWGFGYTYSGGRHLWIEFSGSTQ